MSEAAIAFGIVFLAELIDTSGLVTLALSARFGPRWVLLGVGAGMAVHVVVAIVAGSLLTLLPQRLLEGVLVVAFLVGAFLLVRGEDDDDDDEVTTTPVTRWSVVATAFGITVLSEFADPSQLVVATLAARYSAPIAVGVGSLLALWAASALAVYFGDRIQRFVPVRWVTIVTAGILVVLAVITAIDAIRG
ncbi:TMEM165/GDT1 family protein [Pseudonocardia endophytica]|uniref:GDT1 family protein n=1 Tax=Pseudonocardia endophytica TaxID=401976 RepID=A0A4R1HXE0_PSEEN|nr:TMEM165/GDT1 family protein [Pseudonocardia endophytica]TCK24729.1 putative Ca2+/H+ antiporter (TMEM165/GDT1 family) [Pseudonocardia endophytica]